MKESHIKKAGRYTVTFMDETKDIDIYLLPSGLYLPVEHDDSGIAAEIYNEFGKFELTKVSKKQQGLINGYMKDYEELFDGCLFFEVNNTIEQVAANE